MDANASGLQGIQTSDGPYGCGGMPECKNRETVMLNMEYTVPSTTIRLQSFATISGHTDYTAIIAKPGAAGGSS